MDFSQALAQIKTGTRMRRSGWIAWLAIVPSNFWALGIALPFAAGFVNLTTDASATSLMVGTATAAPAASAQLGAFIVVQTKDGTLMPWTANQSDILAADWEVAT